jgi:hypothetical protein
VPELQPIDYQLNELSVLFSFFPFQEYHSQVGARGIFFSVSGTAVVALGLSGNQLKFNFMYTALLVLHSILRWVILLLGFVAVFKSYSGMTAGKRFYAGDRKVGLFLMIAAHTTLLVGLYLWLTGPWGLANIRNLGFGEVMKDKVYRFYAVEHLFGMLVAIVLITLGRGAAKKPISDRAKHKRTFWFVLVALVIILATVPWPFRAGIARPWL